MDESKKPGRHFGLGLGRLLGGGEDPPDASADEPSDDDETPQTDPALHDLPSAPPLSDDGDDPLAAPAGDHPRTLHVWDDGIVEPDATADAVAASPDGEVGAVAEPEEEPHDDVEETPEEDSDTPPTGVEPEGAREEDDMANEDPWASSGAAPDGAAPPAEPPAEPPTDVAVAEPPADAGEAEHEERTSGVEGDALAEPPARPHEHEAAPRPRDPFAAYRSGPAPAAYRVSHVRTAPSGSTTAREAPSADPLAAYRSRNIRNPR